MLWFETRHLVSYKGRKKTRFSRLHLLEFTDGFFELGGDGIQFAAAANRRVARLVAELEQFAQRSQRPFRGAAQRGVILDHILGDG